MTTKIEWASETWNPVTGCTPISEGCKNCYAKRMFSRKLWGYGFHPGMIHEERFEQPSHWRRPRRIFVCSMGDLFHEAVSQWVLMELGAIMHEAKQHTFMLLTKRPKAMQGFVQRNEPIWPNVWLGVTAENQAAADRRIPVLEAIPAAVRFVSVEPCLQSIDIGEWNFEKTQTGAERYWHPECLHWVIAGPETGPGARPCKEEWLMDLRDQCKAAGVPFFLKRHADGSKAEPELQQWPTPT